MTATMAEPKRCETCGRTVCDVRVAGGGGVVKADWPPFVPVVEMDQMLITYFPTIPTVGEDWEPLPFYYEGFRPGSPAGACLVREHRCDELTDMTRVLTARGHEVVRTQGSGAVAGPVKA
jgi:hypothetical protein